MIKQYTTRRAYIELHSSVLLWGFTGIIGRLITLDATLLVAYRMLFTALSFLVVNQLYAQLRTLTKQQILQLAGIGVFVSFHWVAFYGAIHLSNVSVAVGCLATTSLFTAFIEPLLFRQKVQWLQVIAGLFVSLGLSIMFLYGQQFSIGIIVALCSAFFAALFTSLNKFALESYNPPPIAMSFIQMSAGFLVLLILLPVYLAIYPQQSYIPSKHDFLLLLLLAIVCTTLPYILSLRALKQLSAFNAVLAINLEPVYSIILAIFIFKENEELNWQFYVGTAIVVCSVLCFPLIANKIKD